MAAEQKCHRLIVLMPVIYRAAIDLDERHGNDAWLLPLPPLSRSDWSRATSCGCSATWQGPRRPEIRSPSALACRIAAGFRATSRAFLRKAHYPRLSILQRLGISVAKHLL